MEKKCHTIVLSDMHLSDAEIPNSKRPLWKKFKRKKYFVDDSFSEFLDFMQTKIKEAPIELILNGDIFDFDSVMSLPTDPSFSISRHEKIHSLNSLEAKSAFKIQKILDDHDIFTEAISNFIKAGHNLVFVIGNHDIELYWPKVQKIICEKFGITDQTKSKIRFCEWFYISENDTLIEHGHQYDPYCLCLDPLNPIIKKNGEFRIRLPFGNLANRFMTNGMGLKNPHSDASFLKTTWEFVTFFFKYEIKIQPLMLLTWFTGAIRTLIYSLGEGILPAQKDPLTFAHRLNQVANRSKSTAETVLTLRQNHAHPAIMKPFMILRELWLDRAFLMFAIIWGCWQIFTTSALFANLSLWWFVIPLLLLQPFFIYYAHSVQSEVHSNARLALDKAPLSAKASGVKRIIHGHTHRPLHSYLTEDFEYLNTGAWTPIFEDPECTKPRGQKLFAWINPDQNRSLNLYQWKDSDIILSSYTKKFKNNVS